jgi:diacylglycerol kinase (ATP)
MRAAVVFGLGTSPQSLDPFRSGSSTQWVEGLPSSSGDADAILIFGGDGTIHRHLPALVRLQVPVLVVPSGSGNDFARALKLRSAKESVRAWRQFEAGNAAPCAIDLGLIIAKDSGHRHYFCCVAGCGLDASVARRANRMPRWLRGRGGYAVALLPELRRLPAFRARIVTTTDGRCEESNHPTMLIAFANTQYYGDGMKIAPRASSTDGQVDICRIAPVSRRKLLTMFPSVYLGGHVAIPEVEYSRADSVRVETELPMDVYADGERVCATPVEIKIAAGALRVIATGAIE